jgi:hypothetical protein
MLWVDALCINQEDTTERNHQVMQMGAIYEKAKRVVVWLGRPKTMHGVVKPPLVDCLDESFRNGFVYSTRAYKRDRT